MSERKSTKVDRVCEHCKNSFLIAPYRINRGEGKFCSYDCARSARRLSVHDYFKKHQAPPNEHGCIFWLGSLNVEGYGKLSLRQPPVPPNPRGVSKVLSAHRVAYELANGPIPNNLSVCHSCDHFYPIDDKTYRRCVNPKHLWLGSCADNSADMVSKGRSRKGQRISWSKLTDENARSILEHYADGSETITSLASKYNVSGNAIHAILTRLTWTHIDFHNWPSINARLRPQLTEDKVKQIRSSYKRGETTFRKLGLLFNVDARTVHRIIHRQTWKNIT